MGIVAKMKTGGSSGTEHLIAPSAYGTCTTAADTAAKTVTLANFDTFVPGETIWVRFTNSNTVANPTLNVNSKGAKNIYAYGTTAPGTTVHTSWQAGAVVGFTYNTDNNSSGCWVMNNYIANTDSGNTASAVDNILDGSNSGTAITYAPYSSQQSKLSFDTSTTAPTRSDRLNLNGYLYATKLYSGNTEVSVVGHTHSYAASNHNHSGVYKPVQTAVTTATAGSGTTTTVVSSVTQDTNGVISVTTKSIPTYNNYSLPVAKYNTLGGVKPAYSYTGAATLTTSAASATTAPTIAAKSTTSGRYYAVETDKDGILFVNVPWSAGSSVSTATSSTTGITVSTATTTANKTTVGTSSTDYGVTAAGSGGFTSGSFSGGSGSFSATVSNEVLSFSHTHTAATHGADSHTHTAPTLGSKVPTVSTSNGSITVTLNDPGHTHSLS